MSDEEIGNDTYIQSSGDVHLICTSNNNDSVFILEDKLTSKGLLLFNRGISCYLA